jgi:hypothetical protein
MHANLDIKTVGEEKDVSFILVEEFYPFQLLMG